jgi:hypothetical protein
VLWIFGLLAGATAGSLSIGRLVWPDDVGSPFSTDATSIVPAQLPTWLAEHAPQVAMLVAAALVAVLGLLAASVVARGGITQATLELSRGRTASLGGIVRAGARWFWPFLGLLVLLGVVLAVVLGMVVLAALSLGSVGAVLAAGVLSVGVVASIVLAYAERSIVVYDLGPLAALQAGWRLFQAHTGASLLAWSLSVGLAFGAAMVATMAIATLLLFFGGLGLASVLATLGLLVLLAAVANTFFWSYWTLAYVRLEGDNEGQLAAP